MKCCKDRSVSLFLLLKSRFDLNTISVVFVEIEKAKNPLRYPPSPISSFFLRVRVGGGEKGDLLLFFHAFEIMVGEIAAASLQLWRWAREEGKEICFWDLLPLKVGISRTAGKRDIVISCRVPFWMSIENGEKSHRFRYLHNRLNADFLVCREERKILFLKWLLGHPSEPDYSAVIYPSLIRLNWNQSFWRAQSSSEVKQKMCHKSLFLERRASI